jgi:hypothetical protein
MRWLLFELVGGAACVLGALMDHFWLGLLVAVGCVVISDYLVIQDNEKEKEAAARQMERAEAGLKEAKELEAKERQRLEEEKRLQARRERLMKIRMRKKRRKKAT